MTEPGPADHAILDASLRRLRRTLPTADRLAVLMDLVQYWHGPIKPEDGIGLRELSTLTLPEPLRWWYGWAGRRTGLMGEKHCNRLYHPSGLGFPDDCLKIVDGKLVFYVEAQGVYAWFTEPAGDDPPVFCREASEKGMHPEGIVLSEHLIMACLFQVIQHNLRACFPSLDRATMERMLQGIPAMDIGTWTAWGGMHFHAAAGVFAMWCSLNGREFCVWIAAVGYEPVQFLREFSDQDAEHLDLEEETG